MNYTINHFIKKFSKIPTNKWTTGRFITEDGKKCCALGHCGDRDDKNTQQGNTLNDLFDNHDLQVTSVNDRKSKKFPQKTPRGRVLAALKSFKNAN